MNTRARLESLAETHLPSLLALIDEVVRASSPPGSSLVPMCQYHMGTGGKRLRALIPLLVAETMDVQPESVLPFAAACEMLHNATLVHDDLQDGDSVRRGRPTVWKKFGVPQAINLGDAMFYYAALLIGKLGGSAEARERALHRLLVSTLKVIDGQEREFALRNKPTPSLEDYLAMVEGKTAAMFALPLAGTAEWCGADPNLITRLEKAACHLGVLFQIQDDVLDLYGEKGREKQGSDIAEGKRSFLAVYALVHAPAEQAAWLRNVLDRPREETHDEEIRQACRLFDETGALRAAVREIRQRASLAVCELDVPGETPLKTIINDLAAIFCAPIEHLVPSLVEHAA